MKKPILCLPLLGIIVLTAGCMAPPPQSAPQPAQPQDPLVFGVPESAWDKLTQKQKDATIAAYNQQQEESMQAYNQQQQQNAQNAQLQAVVDAASNVINSAINKNDNS